MTERSIQGSRLLQRPRQAKRRKRTTSFIATARIHSYYDIRVNAVNIYHIYGLLGLRFRRQRLKQFVETFQPTPSTTILDVGGCPEFWPSGFPARITIANLSIDPAYQGPHKLVKADGRELPFNSKEFDICFSNSVIEHLGGFDNQRLFANEVQRVGSSAWVQTPAASFPIEPHFLSPCVHYFSPKLRRKLIPLTLWALMEKPSRAQMDAVVAEISLLNASQMAALFPKFEIVRERFLGMTKSLIAVRHDG